MTLFVKLCGIKTEADLEAAVEAGADAVGFVLTPSPRQIPLSVAAEPEGEVAGIGSRRRRVPRPDTGSVGS